MLGATMSLQRSSLSRLGRRQCAHGSTVGREAKKHEIRQVPIAQEPERASHFAGTRNRDGAHPSSDGVNLNTDPSIETTNSSPDGPLETSTGVGTVTPVLAAPPVTRSKINTSERQ